MANCPLCRLQMKAVGRLVAAIDDVGQHFTFSVCVHCATRLDRLPSTLQRKQLACAIRNLAADPERYCVMFHDGAHEATLFCRLEAERLASALVASQTTVH